MKVSEQAWDDVKVFVLDGRMDSVGALDVESALNAALAAEHHKTVLDMACVPYVGSIGLRVLVEVLKSNRAAGGDLKLAALNPRVLRVLQIIQFDRLFSIYEAVEQAVASF